MNIPEQYQAGMALPAGEYQVEVSAAGYRTVTEIVVHGTEPTERRIALARAGRETLRDCRELLRGVQCHRPLPCWHALD